MRALFRKIVVAGLVGVSLAACSTVAPPGPVPPPVTERANEALARQLVGAWALRRLECASDNGLVYKSESTWQSYSAYGTWSVFGAMPGARLETVTTHSGEGLGDEKPLNPPRRETASILELTGERLITRWPDGAQTTLVRCPAPVR